MKTAQPTPTQTPAERRAAKIAAWEERRRRKGKHTAGDPLRYDVSACPPCGPPGGYVIVNASQPAQEVTVTYVQT